MPRKFTAALVHKTTTARLNQMRHHERVSSDFALRYTQQPYMKPFWYNTVGRIPSPELLTRVQPDMTAPTTKSSRTRKASKLFQPRPIIYAEDRLRQNFFKDHPWELARPRMVLEEDGKDVQRCDWSRIEQPGRPLDGESVVQRQLWLMQNNKTMTTEQAYDTARREFYAIRHEEDVQRRVAKEEAESTGAYFGMSRIDVGVLLEDQVFNAWKESAEKEVTAIVQERSGDYTEIGEEPSAAPVIEEAEDILLEGAQR